MSKHPTERVRSVAEIQAKASMDSDKALRRVVLVEERLARAEARLAERDELIAEFREAYGRQADMLSAMGAVVKELEAKIARGVDQVLTGLEGRIAELERETPIAHKELRELIALNEKGVPSIAAHVQLEHRVADLEAKPKRGRPKGSKNKPKAQAQFVAKGLAGGMTVEAGKDVPAVEESPDAYGENTPQDGDSSNPEASEV